jgi:pyruvate dehydrogenase E2 component (dihydrolipoamide acetyltransferase)
MFEFKLPSLGADMDEGTLLEWRVQSGDTVHKGQVVAVVDTAKAAIDIEIWQDGTVLALQVQAGEKVPVGTVLATLLAPGEQAGAALASDTTRPVGGLATLSRPPQEPAPSPASAAGEATTPVPQSATPVMPGTQARVRISPAARLKAQTLGLDVGSLRGSGPDGAITLADVERASAAQPNPSSAPATPAAATAPAPDRQTEIRRAIASAMSRSKREIPHYYLLETIPMARAQQWLAQANEGRPITTRLLMAALQLKAVALVLQRFPELNGLFIDGQFQPAPAAHIGVAISLRQGGLIAPALHNVDQLPLDTLMPALADLVKRTRAGSLRQSEMADASITVTNLGDQGVEAVIGVIHPPQVAIVGFGRVAARPWVDAAGGLCVVPTVTASLAADHRVSDGHRGGLFLAELRELLQQPQDL